MAMLGVIITLKPRSVARDWAQAGELYKGALRSALGQAREGFRVVTVCHEVPEGVQENASHQIISLGPGPGSRMDSRQQWSDFLAKKVRGLEATRDCSHVLFLDYDDRISARLASVVASSGTETGWYFPQGYHWRTWSSRAHLWQNFHLFCGTSSILPRPLVDQVLRAPCPATSCDQLLHHNRVREAGEQCGVTFEPLPFPGAVYVYSRRENYSYTQRYFWLWGWRRFLLARPRRVPTRQIDAEFGGF